MNAFNAGFDIKPVRWAFFLMAFILLIGCAANKKTAISNLPNTEQQELFSIDGSPTYTDEFIYVYNKNNINNDSAYTQKDINDYLDLYVNFKLKIKEAKNRGMDTTQAFINEYNTYKEQLKKPYLTENKVTEKLIKEAYDRYKQEINASHILLSVAPDASPEDTLSSYNEIMQIRQKAIEGEDFSTLAKQYSDDPSAKTNGGNLGYFTSFQMVYPFESAAYNTPPGSVSPPVRTKFGYHIVKVLDNRPSQGSVEVSHIMIRVQPTKIDSVEARNKIFEIYDQAVGGVNWDDLAKQFSEDMNTKNTGGKLRPFKAGQMPFSFQEAAYALQQPGDISDPVMTPYGWHIIRLERKIPLESFEEMENGIKSRINRDSRAQLSKQVFISRLKNENQFKEAPIKDNIWTFADSSLTSGTWAYPANDNMLKEELFSIAGNRYSVSDFFAYLKKNQRPNSYDGVEYMKQIYNKYVDEELITYEEAHLEDKYEDYRMLSREYREGILLFQLMEEEVWDKAVEDSIGLKGYYENNVDQYTFGPRVKATIYNASEKSIITEIRNDLSSGDSLNLSNEALEKKYNAKGALSLQIEEGVFEKGDNDISDAVPWKEGIYTRELNGRNQLVVIHQLIAPGPKPLNEIKGLVISDYQNLLEKKWVAALKEKYPVRLNEKGIKQIHEKLENK